MTLYNFYKEHGSVVLDSKAIKGEMGTRDRYSIETKDSWEQGLRGPKP